ncbi:MAG: hypothetical protein A2527_00835 [Candidatus Lambdaproteobacteria bacterium RIFOXYD2_FULL_50_16]|uniref:DUF3147 family protein n=1 Tax=Candidatus Lambdaproteobacteria bacterium RIFOXYD2_FULL_50_16 TaxID=1817772 RepID=A0A1F6GFF2_9PROT|nr:MAG: hypothetical protein A2527_00835 [Candidatus Lambdaproteobacteria bacterium RIFOXYD2_FULL_50_16]
MPWWIKLLLTGAIVTGATELAKTSGRLGAFVMVLPWMTLTTIVWLRVEGYQDKIPDLLRPTLWYIIPSLPIFIGLPWLMDKGYNLWISLGFLAFLGTLLFVVEVWILKFFGVELL